MHPCCHFLCIPNCQKLCSCSYRLQDVLKTSDPTKELWWNKFIELENIRDEIIHSKQSNSVERYSKLLSKGIFEIISINDTIIKYYGKYILENNPNLLEDYPYGFGFDEFYPGLTNDENYELFYRDIFNPSSIKFIKKSE